MKKKYTLKYRRLTVRLDFNPRKNRCECCGIKSKQLQLHHWKYAYTTDEIREFPIKAIENSSTLCYFCHKLANDLKHIHDNKERIEKLEKLSKYEEYEYKYFPGRCVQ